MASGINVKANTNVPEEADTLLVFGLVLAILAVGVIFIIKSLTGALIGVGHAAASLPGELARSSGEGIGAGIYGSIKNLFGGGD